MYMQVLVLLLGVTYGLCRLQSRITAGVDIPTPNFVVSIQHRHQHICSGAIFDANHVITSASCVEKFKNEPLTIRQTSLTHAGGGNIRYVTRIKCNNRYDPLGNEWDVALLQVADMVATARVATTTTALIPGEPLDIWGWGVYDRTNTLSDRLKRGSVNLMSRDLCVAQLGSTMIGQTVMCSPANVSTACDGDGGGPLTKGTAIYGIISWNNRCSVAPTIYTDVNRVKDYLLECIRL